MSRPERTGGRGHCRRSGDKNAGNGLHAHRDDRRRLNDLEAGLPNDVLDAVALIFLDIEEQQVAARCLCREVELIQQIRLYEIQRRDEKRTESERQHHRPRLVRRPVEVGDTLPHHVWPTRTQDASGDGGKHHRAA